MVPPWIRHRFLPFIAGDWHAAPERVRAEQRRAACALSIGLIRSVSTYPPCDELLCKDGLTAVLNLLAAGKRVVMFPEGTRTPDGELQPLKPGVALLVKKAKCPVGPVGLVGAYDSWPKKRPLPVPAPLGVFGPGAPLGVSFGEPVPPGFYDAMKREEIVTDLHRRIADAFADARRRRG